jgi:hypothetical protein
MIIIKKTDNKKTDNRDNKYTKDNKDNKYNKENKDNKTNKDNKEIEIIRIESATMTLPLHQPQTERKEGVC